MEDENYDEESDAETMEDIEVVKFLLDNQTSRSLSLSSAYLSETFLPSILWLNKYSMRGE